MSHRAEVRRSAEARSTCPHCGREATSLATGHCLYCLKPLTGGREVETQQILHLSDFDRSRGRMRSARGRRASRTARASLVGIAVGALLVGLFSIGMHWLLGFFGRGTAWRQ